MKPSLKNRINKNFRVNGGSFELRLEVGEGLTDVCRALADLDCPHETLSDGSVSYWFDPDAMVGGIITLIPPTA